MEKTTYTESEKEWMRQESEFRPLQNIDSLELFRKYQETKDPASLSELCIRNWKLVRYCIRRRSLSKEEWEDIFQEGMMGLIRAIERYDPEKGKFITYAKYWIKQAIQRSMERTTRNIQRPFHVQATTNEIMRFRNDFEKKHGVEPTFEDIQKVFQYPREKLLWILESNEGTVSLQTKIEKDDPKSMREKSVLADLVESPHNFEEEAVNQVLMGELKNQFRILNEREQKILCLRFGIGEEEPHTLSSIGNTLGLSHEMERQIQNKALKKLKRKLA